MDPKQYIHINRKRMCCVTRKIFVIFTDVTLIGILKEYKKKKSF